MNESHSRLKISFKIAYIQHYVIILCGIDTIISTTVYRTATDFDEGIFDEFDKSE